MQKNLWQTESYGIMASKSGDLRLMVKQVGPVVRFLVLRPVAPGSKQLNLLHSGTAPTASAAMDAAEEIAERTNRDISIEAPWPPAGTAAPPPGNPP